MKTLPNDIIFDQVEQTIAQSRIVRMRIKGVSMYPFMRDGKDFFVLRAFSLEEIRTGDIMLFRFNDSHILHRLEKIKDGKYHFRGDGSFKATEIVEEKDLVALVEKVEYAKGKISQRESSHFRCFYRFWRILKPLRWLIIKSLRLFW